MGLLVAQAEGEARGLTHHEAYEQATGGPYTIHRTDGGTHEISQNAVRTLRLCASCVDGALRELITRYAAALMRLAGGSQERALVELCRRGPEWQDLGSVGHGKREYRSTIRGEAVVVAMARSRPEWLMPTAQRSLARALAYVARTNGAKPPIVEFTETVNAPTVFGRNRSKSVSVGRAPMWHFGETGYGDVIGWVRSDGDLLIQTTSAMPRSEILRWAGQSHKSSITGTANEGRYPLSDNKLVRYLCDALDEVLNERGHGASGGVDRPAKTTPARPSVAPRANPGPNQQRRKKRR